MLASARRRPKWATIGLLLERGAGLGLLEHVGGRREWAGLVAGSWSLVFGSWLLGGGRALERAVGGRRLALALCP